MNSHIAASPVSLSYVASLRGIAPRELGAAFTYADLPCVKPDLLTCLAASNPEGQFFGLVASEPARLAASAEAEKRGVTNVTFLAGSIATLCGQAAHKSALLPKLDYLSCDESEKPLMDADRKALFELSETLLKEGGLFNYTYRPYTDEEGALRFLVRELGPEMDAGQAKTFLGEIKKLGSFYFAKHADVAKRLENAAAKGTPDEFFDAFEGGDVHSGAFDTIVALRPRGFSYVGDAHIPSNYIELSVPHEAQDVIATCSNSPLYEAVKDFALDRGVRSDIWCHKLTATSPDLSKLFGTFTYGITRPRDEVPLSFEAQGKKIDLNSPLFARLIDLMTLMPVSVGDFLAHPTGEGFAPIDVVGAIQILVACGFAQPMRGIYQVNNIANVEQPRLVGGFNQYLDKLPVTDHEMWLASPVLGGAVAITPRDALVMQALGRAGLANSVSALLPELEKLAKNPAVASRIMDTATPTPEMARSMIQDVVSKSIVQWYAYGLLEAA